MIEKTKKWIKERRTKWALKRSQRYAQFIAKNNPSVMQNVIHQHAQRLAVVMVMEWMDKEGIRHCCYCPSKGPLRKLRPNTYICETHYKEELKRESNEKEAQPHKKVA